MNFDKFAVGVRQRNSSAFVFDALKVKFDGFLNKLQYLLLGFPNCDASWEIRGVCPIAAWTLLDNNHISHDETSYFRPACFRTLLSVPGGTSTLGFPETVTVPELDG